MDIKFKRFEKTPTIMIPATREISSLLELDHFLGTETVFPSISRRNHKLSIETLLQ